VIAKGFCFLLQPAGDLAGIEEKSTCDCLDVRILARESRGYISSWLKNCSPRRSSGTNAERKACALACQGSRRKALWNTPESITALEFVNAVLARMNHVPRNERGRKASTTRRVVESSEAIFNGCAWRAYTSHLPWFQSDDDDRDTCAVGGPCCSGKVAAV